MLFKATEEGCENGDSEGDKNSTHFPEITIKIDKDSTDHRKIECKMLVLGPANAGKSTLIRNLRIIHECAFSEDEIFGTIESIRAMTLEALVTLIRHGG